MPWATYEYARRCTGGARPGAVALMTWINRNYPQSKNWGIYSCKGIPGSSSLSIHGEGRALDVGYSLVNGKANPDGYRLFNHLRTYAIQLGIQGIIWDRKISTNRGDNRAYNSAPDPTSAHVDHLHIELTNAASQSLTVAKISEIMGSPPNSTTPLPGIAGSGELGAGIDVLTSGETWLRIGMFIGGVILVLLGLGAFTTDQLSRLLNGNVTQTVKTGYRAVIK